MRTPGNDIDLAHGLLYSEGIIRERSDIVLARYCARTGPAGITTYNVLDVTLVPGVPPTVARRNVTMSSACGICGTATIEEVLREAPYGAATGLCVPAELGLTAPARP